ncbi:MAG: diguanylate cyclase [Gammaproteobacteria bacterium]|nr:diguanylate cyclase [Gammaproteobacteria bacterium]
MRFREPRETQFRHFDCAVYASNPGGGVVTVSIGVACQPELGERLADTGPAALLARADQALYQAKAEGRNRVVDGGYQLLPAGPHSD